jgi:hypothetical protein
MHGEVHEAREKVQSARVQWTWKLWTVRSPEIFPKLPALCNNTWVQKDDVFIDEAVAINEIHFQFTVVDAR